MVSIRLSSSLQSSTSVTMSKLLTCGSILLVGSFALSTIPRTHEASPKIKKIMSDAATIGLYGYCITSIASTLIRD